MVGGNITLTAVGRMKTKHWRTAQDEYIKRLSRYTKFKLVEVKDVVGRGLLDDVALQKEGDGLLKGASNAQYLIALTPDGKQFDSPQLAEFVQKKVVQNGRLAFLIGGPIGFAPHVLDQCQTQIALSRLTFTHEMARVLFLEQLYRAYTILNNESYHK